MEQSKTKLSMLFQKQKKKLMTSLQQNFSRARKLELPMAVKKKDKRKLIWVTEDVETSISLNLTRTMI